MIDTQSLLGCTITLTTDQHSLKEAWINSSTSSQRFLSLPIARTVNVLSDWPLQKPEKRHNTPSVLAFPTITNSCHAAPIYQSYFSCMNASEPLGLESTLLPTLPKIPEKKKPKKRYKPVAKKIVPVGAPLNEDFRVIRHYHPNPLAGLQPLPAFPTDFVSTSRYTQEAKDIVDKSHPSNFLWPEERKLMHALMMQQEDAFAWNETQKGRFKEEYFPPVVFPVLPHTPWVLKNMPIPPGIYQKVIEQVRAKIEAGVYEPSNSSYRSRWFTMVKKDGSSL